MVDENLTCSVFERIVHEYVESLSQDGPIAMDERAVVRVDDGERSTVGGKLSPPLCAGLGEQFGE